MSMTNGVWNAQTLPNARDSHDNLTDFLSESTGCTFVAFPPLDGLYALYPTGPLAIEEVRFLFPNLLIPENDPTLPTQSMDEVMCLYIVNHLIQAINTLRDPLFSYLEVNNVLNKMSPCDQVHELLTPVRESPAPTVPSLADVMKTKTVNEYEMSVVTLFAWRVIGQGLDAADARS